MDWSTLVLAKHLGQTLTPDVLTAIARELLAGPAMTGTHPLRPAQQVRAHNDYDLETAEYLRYGIKVFQAVMLADTEEGHAQAMYDAIRPEKGSVFVDMGCGVGEMSRLFSKIDRHALFYSVTNSEIQAALTRSMGGSEVVLADFHDTGIHSEAASVVMFNETWGYGDPQRLAQEAFRLLVPGGRIVIKDWYAVESGYSPEWDWSQWSLQDLHRPLLDAGFRMLQTEPIKNPERDRYRQFMQSSALMQRMHPRGLRLEATPAFIFGTKP